MKKLIWKIRQIISKYKVKLYVSYVNLTKYKK